MAIGFDLLDDVVQIVQDIVNVFGLELVQNQQLILRDLVNHLCHLVLTLALTSTGEVATFTVSSGQEVRLIEIVLGLLSHRRRRGHLVVVVSTDVQRRLVSLK